MLQGERILLRAITRDDLQLLCAFNNDLEVELAGGGDPPIPQGLERLQSEFDQEVAKGGRDGNHFGIEADGKFIGQCALFNIDTTSRTCELGITIGDKEYWGRGYGRECIQLLLKYAFQYRNYHKVFLRVHGSNQRAIRAYQVCGFVEEGRLRAQVWSNGKYDDVIYMGILQQEWNPPG